MTSTPDAHPSSPLAWQPADSRPKPGLYVVATPIGQVGDLGPRAAWLLASASLICAEDSRKTMALLQALGIRRPPGSMVSVHAHNEASQSEALVRRGLGGESIVLVSDAGTPAISDPGARLVDQAWRAGLPVFPVPGPSALTAALSVSGFWQDEARPLCFWGFLPARSQARQEMLREIDRLAGISVVFEAPHRIEDCLADIETVMGADRQLMVGRELTKTFETLLRGSLAEIQVSRAAQLARDSGASQGEYVLVFGPRSGPTATADHAEQARWAGLLATELPKPAAARLLAKAFGISRDEAYRLTRSSGPEDAAD